MTEKGYVDVSIILDRSGSMYNKEEGTINGFNELLRTQKKIPGKCTISLFQFDHEYLEIYKNINIHDAKELNKETYVTRGSTALLDAVGKAINDRGNYFNGLQEHEKPEKVLIVIMTDGEENSSTEFSKSKIKETIEHQRSKYGWEIMFIGAGIDSFTEAGGMGVSKGYTYNVSSNNLGMTSGFACFDNLVSYSRGK